MSQTTERTRELRQRQTKAESLLWQVLRAKRFCRLKFRRQHPVGPFFADFACTEIKCLIELDGGYHDCVEESDAARQDYLENEGWRVIRFVNEDVLRDVESVAVSIARQLGLELTVRGKKLD
jgi:very-short-patch-repair endonuclease